MAVRFAGIFLACTDVDASAALYKRIGLPLKAATRLGEKWACDVDGMHFVLSDREPGHIDAATKLSFVVDRLDVVMDAMRQAGATVREAPTPKPWGITATVADLDGRSIELIAAHIEWTGPMPL